MTSDLVPPGLAPVEHPAIPFAAGLTVVLWFAAGVAGLAGLATTAADGRGLQDRLVATVAETSTASAALLRSGVRTTLLVVLGAQLLLALALLVWTAFLLRRRSWARWWLVGTGMAAALVALVAQQAVAGGVDVDRMTFLAEAGLVLAGLAGLSGGPVRGWLRNPGG